MTHCTISGRAARHSEESKTGSKKIKFQRPHTFPQRVAPRGNWATHTEEALSNYAARDARRHERCRVSGDAATLEQPRAFISKGKIIASDGIFKGIAIISNVHYL